MLLSNLIFFIGRIIRFYRPRSFQTFIIKFRDLFDSFKRAKRIYPLKKMSHYYKVHEIKRKLEHEINSYVIIFMINLLFFKYLIHQVNKPYQ